MKNNFSQELIQLAYKKYQKLRNDPKYLADYGLYAIVNRKIKEAKGNKAIADDLTGVLFSLWSQIIKDWDLYAPIDPKLKISASEIKKPIRPRSSLAKLIYCLGVFGDSSLISKEMSKKADISDKATYAEKNQAKVLCFILKERLSLGISKIGRLLGKDKNTVNKWIDEISELPEDAKQSLVGKYFGNQPDCDAMSSQSLYTSLDKLEYKISNQGEERTYRKSKHRSYED